MRNKQPHDFRNAPKIYDRKALILSAAAT